MAVDERTLVSKAARGERAALESLLESHLPRLRAYVRLHAGPAILRRESSEDIVQSVCREALQSMDRMEYLGEAQFRGWLYTATVRKISKRYAFWRASRRGDGAGGLAPNPQIHDDGAELEAACRSISTPSGKLVSAEEIERIEAALAKLPDERREIVLLSRMLGLSHREIAERMGRTENACRILLTRALAELAKNLSADSSSQESGRP
jgi:RNA polymerase sigma-70 factor (ECF subfamily)